MNAPNDLIICPNGHQQQNAESKFCIFCGTPLSIQSPPQQFNQQPLHNQQPQNYQQPPNNQPRQQPTAPPQNQAPQLNQQQTQPSQFNQQPNQPRNQAPPQSVQNYSQQPPPAYGQNDFPPNQNYPNQSQLPPNNYQQPVPYYPVQKAPPQCRVCGVNGERLPAEEITCQECGWLRPLGEGYGIDYRAFQWAEDGKAMSALRSLTPLTAAAKAISDKVGRRWVETTFNGVLLSEKQLPNIYSQAVRAARILGMTHMPDVYVSGEVMWDCRTYGSDRDSFIVIGTSLAANFRDDELLFLFAREMGHCRAGHALWKTVIRFLLGEQGPRKGLLAGGLFAALSPTNLIEGALEMPLLAWARQAEITADRAGLLAVGDEEIARKVLLSWSLKSPFLYKQINLEAWLEQQSASDDDMTRLSELTTSSTPYITRRLKIMEQFALSSELSRWREIINRYAGKAEQEAVKQAETGQLKVNTIQFKFKQEQSIKKEEAVKKEEDVIRMKCASCDAAMKIPKKILEGKEQMAIRCPNSECGKITNIKKRVSPAVSDNPNTVPVPKSN